MISVFLMPGDIALDHVVEEVSAEFLPCEAAVFPSVLNNTIVHFVSILYLSHPFYLEGSIFHSSLCIHLFSCLYECELKNIHFPLGCNLILSFLLFRLFQLWFLGAPSVCFL